MDAQQGLDNLKPESKNLKPRYALSIKQPWSWLICAGYKDIENRTWKIGRNPRHGPFSTRDIDNFTIALSERIYVHAGKKIEWKDYNFLVLEGWITTVVAGDLTRYLALSNGVGAIIGEVDITGCVTESESPWFTGPYGFTLANPVLYDKPIPYRGQLGFFEVPDLVPAPSVKGKE